MIRQRRYACLLYCFSFCLFAANLQASEVKDEASKEKDRPAGRTMGGKQLWTDHFVYRGWRIQKYVVTGHFRLLNDKNKREAYGSFGHCRSEFARLVQEDSIPPLKPKVVLTIHGLGRSRQSMDGIGKYLADNGEYEWLNMTYASTRAELADHAKALADVMDGLRGVEQVNFVAHSLGNLVIRRYLHDQAQRDELPPDYPRIGRIVMLAPPNGGAQMARRLAKNRLFQLVAGESGSQLSTNWSDVQKTLLTPNSPFGIIAGGVGRIGNPAIQGPDDWIVSVNETRLAGAHDFLVVPSMHTFIMDNEEVQKASLSFLQKGWFVTDDKRQPIPRSETP